ncbi:MAG: NUDIX domain-containing protein [Candidatus Dojkabacteria bacterium]|nr:MAG: NUDIX domain-containing protein [Candidatus Dojkabacteria bacterium]
MSLTPDIFKIAALILSEGKLLVVRKKDTDVWISLGGKPEPEESHQETLQREILEEIGVLIIGTPSLFHESPVEYAEGKPGKTVKIYSYLVTIVGTPRINVDDQIEEFQYISKQDFESQTYKLGSVLEKFVVPKLIREGLMC